MGVRVLDRLGDAFAVGDLRFANDRFHTVGALQDVDLNVEVKLTHALENGFTGILVRLNDEGRVFRHHLTDRGAHLFRVTLILRFDRDGDNGLWEHHGLECSRVRRIA